MKIAVIIKDLRIGGGAERAASIIGNELQKRGHDVHFVVFKDQEIKYPIRGQYSILNTKVPTNNSFKAFLNIIFRAWKIASFCKSEQTDAIISFMEEANFPSIISRMLFGNKARLVVSVRENPHFKRGKAKAMMKLLHNKADMVVANSRATEKILNDDFGIKKTFTIYNSIDFDDSLKKINENIPKDEEEIFKGGNTFINIGRLNIAKGQWHLIRSFADATRCKPELKLVIIGEGELEDDYREMIDRLNLRDKIFLFGRKQNIFPYLIKARAFLFTSIWEGMPNVLIEAAFLGLPIVSVDCSNGPREIMAPELEVDEKIDYPYGNKNGILLDKFKSYPFFDSLSDKPLSDVEKSFSSAILDILNREKKGEAAIKEKEEFSLDNVIEIWEMIIKGDL